MRWTDCDKCGIEEEELRDDGTRAHIGYCWKCDANVCDKCQSHPIRFLCDGCYMEEYGSP